jgi:uncharacterized YkwD family protein
MKKKNLLVSFAVAGFLFVSGPLGSASAAEWNVETKQQNHQFVYSKSFNLANPEQVNNLNVNQMLQDLFKHYGFQYEWKNNQSQQPSQLEPVEQEAEKDVDQPNQEQGTQSPQPAPIEQEVHEETVQQEEEVASSLSAYEQQVVTLTNQERAKYGLPDLKVDEQLSKVARAKSIDMSKNNYFSHTSPTYGSPFNMMSQFGVDYRTAGENIAMGQRSPEEVVNAWMNSEGHRKNILNESFTHIGVGHVEDGNYWTQQFIGK